MSRAVLTGIYYCALVTVLEAGTALQQNGPWRVFGASDGFPESFRSLTVSETGTVVAISSDASIVCIFDGYNIKSINMPKWPASRVYQSPAGQLWTWSSKGLCTMRYNSWQLLSSSELDGALQSSNYFDAPLYPLRQNVVLCFFPQRLV